MISSYFSQDLIDSYVATKMFFNLYKNDYNGELTMNYSSSNLLNTIRYAEIILDNNQFVNVKTAISNCASVFVENADIDEYLFNAIFSGFRFTIAISPINLFNKSFELSNGLFVYKLMPFLRQNCTVEDQKFMQSDEFKNKVKTIRIEKPLYTTINKYYKMAEIFENYWLIYSFMEYTRMRQYTNALFIATYYLKYKNYKKEFDFVAYRTGNRLAVMVSK